MKYLKTSESEKISVIHVAEQIVCDHYKISQDAIRSKSRLREIVLPRQVAHWLVATNYKNVIPLSMIAAIIGNRDHATALHSRNTIDNLREYDQFIKQETDKLNTVFNLRVENSVTGLMLLSEFVADKFGEATQQHLESLSQNIQALKESIEADQVKEGWRKVKDLEQVNEIANEIAKFHKLHYYRDSLVKEAAEKIMKETQKQEVEA